MREERYRVYALNSYTVRWKRRGWYIRPTDSRDHWRGPNSEQGECVAIAYLLKKEIVNAIAGQNEFTSLATAGLFF